METIVNATVLEPIGDLTPEIAARLCAAVHVAVGSERAVVITLRSVARFSWSGLCGLADALRAERRTAQIRFRDVAPRTASLLQAVGLERFLEPRPLHEKLMISA